MAPNLRSLGPGSAGPPGPPGPPGGSDFGDASDGNLILNATTQTLTKPISKFNNVTLTNGALLDGAAGCVLFVKGTLSIDATSIIDASGLDGGNGTSDGSGTPGSSGQSSYLSCAPGSDRGAAGGPYGPPGNPGGNIFGNTSGGYVYAGGLSGSAGTGGDGADEMGSTGGDHSSIGHLIPYDLGFITSLTSQGTDVNGGRNAPAGGMGGPGGGSGGGAFGAAAQNRIVEWETISNVRRPPAAAVATTSLGIRSFIFETDLAVIPGVLIPSDLIGVELRLRSSWDLNWATYSGSINSAPGLNISYSYTIQAGDIAGTFQGTSTNISTSLNADPNFLLICGSGDNSAVASECRLRIAANPNKLTQVDLTRMQYEVFAFAASNIFDALNNENTSSYFELDDGLGNITRQLLHGQPNATYIVDPANTRAYYAPGFPNAGGRLAVTQNSSVIANGSLTDLSTAVAEGLGEMNDLYANYFLTSTLGTVTQPTTVKTDLELDGASYAGVAGNALTVTFFQPTYSTTPWYSFTQIQPGAGAGPNGLGGPGGGGGAGGGGIIIVAANVTILGTIRANGGNGGNGGDAFNTNAGGGGGGCGGGGGVIFVNGNVWLTLGGTFEVNPGTPGTGGAGTGTGLAGAAGGAGAVGKVYKFNGTTQAWF